MNTKDSLRSHYSYKFINTCDSWRIGIIKIIDLYRIRVRKMLREGFRESTIISEQ